MSGDDELAELRLELETARDAARRAWEHVIAGQETIAKMSARLGQMEQQRNHARWKYGRAKRRWREERKLLQLPLVKLTPEETETLIVEHIKQHEELNKAPRTCPSGAHALAPGGACGCYSRQVQFK